MNSIIKKVNKVLNINSLFYIVGIIILIGIWLFSYYQTDNEMIVPSVSVVFEKIFDFIKDQTIFKIILNTIFKVLLVICICLLISLALSITSYKFKWFRSVLSPILVVIKTAPVAAIIIILLISVGLKRTPYYICGFVIVPVMYEAFLHSFLSVDKDIIEETKMISNIDLRIIIKVILPLSFTGIISSILSVFGLGLKVLVMAEIFSSSDDTFGGLLQIFRSVGDMTSIFALTIILIIIVLVVEVIIKYIQNKLRDLK